MIFPLPINPGYAVSQIDPFGTLLVPVEFVLIFSHEYSFFDGIDGVRIATVDDYQQQIYHH